MSSLVLQLQQEASEADCAISTLLRKSLMISKKLKLIDFESWSLNELNGYKNAEDLPNYRKINGNLKYHNPYNGWQDIIVQDEKLAEIIKERFIFDPISNLESLVSDYTENSVLSIPLHFKLEQKIMRGLPDFLQQKPTYQVGCSQIKSILEAVRNTVLTWTLELESQGVTGSGILFSKQEKELASHMTINVTGNFQGNIGNIEKSTVIQDFDMSIKNNDFDSLKSFLKSNAIPEDDINELEQCIKKDPIPKDSTTLGKNVGGWIGKMVGKAVSGAWAIGVEVAAPLLQKAIMAYYGIDIN